MCRRKKLCLQGRPDFGPCVLFVYCNLTGTTRAQNIIEDAFFILKKCSFLKVNSFYFTGMVQSHIKITLDKHIKD